MKSSNVSPIMASLAAKFQADEPMLATQVGALCRWLQDRGAADAMAMCRAAGLDDDHADHICMLAGICRKDGAQ